MSDMQLIGDLKGAKVLIDRETRSVIIASDDFPPIKFSIDHPFIQGTGMERAARAAIEATAATSHKGDTP